MGTSDKCLRYYQKKYDLSEEEIRFLQPNSGLNIASANHMSENVIGTIAMPLYILQGFKVNGKDYSVPVATEQPSIISMIKKGLRFSCQSSGFRAKHFGSIMMGQIQLLDVPDIEKGVEKVAHYKEEILRMTNRLSSQRKALDVTARRLETKYGSNLIVELFVDVKDSMGANIVDEMTETVSSYIASLTGGRANVRVLSNLATNRLVSASLSIDYSVLGGYDIANSIVSASYFAEADPYRAVTHNKGVMNGISSVLYAVGNDIRAVEAGAHAFASLSGQTRPLSFWRMSDGMLVGELSLPMAVGIVGGSISSHPTARVALKILDVKEASELGMVTTCVGLACNLGALHTLVTKGITSLR